MPTAGASLRAVAPVAALWLVETGVVGSWGGVTLAGVESTIADTDGLVQYGLVFVLAAVPWIEILVVVPIALALGSRRRRLLVWMTASLALWTAVLTVVSVYSIGWLRTAGG